MMRRKLLPVLLLLALVAVFCLPATLTVSAAVENRGLTVTGTEGTDYAWATYTDKAAELHIKTNGQTVTGTGAHACIVADAGVTSLTLNDVTITGCDTAVTFQSSGACTLTVTGSVTFGAAGSPAFTQTSATDWTDGVNNGVACIGKLTVTGTPTFNCYNKAYTTPCFDPQNGTAAYYKSAPEKPTKAGQVLLGWFTESVNGSKTETFTAGNTYYAHWATPTTLTYAPVGGNLTTYGTAVTGKTVGKLTVANLGDGALTAVWTSASHDGLTIDVSGTDVVVTAAATTPAGTYNFMVTNGKGSSDPLYKSVTGSVTVAPKTLTANDVTVDYETEKTFNNAAQTFAVNSVKYGGSVLPATSYTVSGNVVKDATTTNLTITFTGNYTGTVTKAYIMKAMTLVDADISIQTKHTFTGQEIKPLVLAKNSIVLTEGVDYTAYYSNNVKAGTANMFILLQGNYDGMTITRTFTIEVDAALNGSVITTITDKEYTGSPISPTDFFVYVGGELLVNGYDYTVSYSNNTAVGTGIVIVTVNNENYKGVLRDTFNIIPHTLTEADVDNVADQPWKGELVQPEVKVHNGDVVLKYTTDYYLTYNNNNGLGTATVTVTGMGTNYKGSVTKSFKIVKDNPKPTLDSIATITDLTYTGKALEPSLTIIVTDTVLTNGIDYTVTYKNNVNAGTAYAVVTFTGKNADITLEKPFTIVPKAMTAANVANIGEQLYTGRAVEPSLTVKDGTTLLKAGSDYTVTYANNVEKGTNTASATVTFIGNYSGTVTKTFTIYEHNYSIFEVIKQDYTGKAIEPTILVFDNQAMLLSMDYTVEYRDNVDVGTATVYVTLQAPYSGFLTTTFTIVPKDSLTADNVHMDAAVIYTGAAIEPTVTVQDGDITLVAGKDYTLTYTDNLNVGTAGVKVTLQGNYSGTLEKSFIILPKELTNDAMSAIEDVYYTGGEYEPTVEIRDGDKVLVEGVDYTKEHLNNTSAGYASVVAYLQGNYNGRIYQDYTINRVPVELLTGPTLSSYTFVADGTAQIPAVYVSYNGVTLTDGVDYTVAFTDNVNPGTAHAVLTFKGNFTGTSDIPYTLNNDILTGVTGTDGSAIAFVTTSGGFDPTVKLITASGAVGKRGSVDGLIPIVPLQDLTKLYEKIAAVYSVTLEKDGAEVQPADVGSAGTVLLALLVPDEVADGSFRLLHVHGANDVRELTRSDEAGIGSYMLTKDGYALIYADALSDFVFIYQPECNMHWFTVGIAGLYLVCFALFTFVLFKKKWIVYVAGGVCAAGAAAMAVFGGCMLCLYFACGVGGLVILGTLYTVFREKLFGPKPEEPDDGEEADAEEDAGEDDDEAAEKPVKDKKEKKEKKEKKAKKEKPAKVKKEKKAKKAKKAEEAETDETEAAPAETDETAPVTGDPYDNDTAAGDSAAQPAADAAETAPAEVEPEAAPAEGQKRHRRTKAEMEAARAEEAARLEELAAQGIVPEEKEKRHRRTKAEMEAARAEEAARLEELAAQGIVPEEKEKRHRRTKAEMEAARAEEAARLEELAAQGIVPVEKEKRHRRTKAEMEAARAAEAAANGEATPAAETADASAETDEQA